MKLLNPRVFVSRGSMSALLLLSLLLSNVAVAMSLSFAETLGWRRKRLRFQSYSSRRLFGHRAGTAHSSARGSGHDAVEQPDYFGAR